mmetsp:Transcript_16398/g.42356  ORF Transcript_16398/g.42356 Transcript_16398/m.42356 type:complete len:231 (+) Transcript_16398:275-967(+)
MSQVWPHQTSGGLGRLSSSLRGSGSSGHRHELGGICPQRHGRPPLGRRPEARRGLQGHLREWHVPAHQGKAQELLILALLKHLLRVVRNAVDTDDPVTRPDRLLRERTSHALPIPSIHGTIRPHALHCQHLVVVLRHVQAQVRLIGLPQGEAEDLRSLQRRRQEGRCQGQRHRPDVTLWRCRWCAKRLGEQQRRCGARRRWCREGEGGHLRQGRAETVAASQRPGRAPGW